jgi:hypothetical protein
MINAVLRRRVFLRGIGSVEARATLASLYANTTDAVVESTAIP